MKRSHHKMERISWRRGGLAVLLLVLDCAGVGFGFVVHDQHKDAMFATRRHHNDNGLLFAKTNSKRRGPSSNSKGGASKKSMNKRSSLPSASQSNQPSKPKKKNAKKNTKTAPPWQVLSTKEAKANVEKEKERRERIRLGIQDTSIDTAASQTTKNQVLSKSFLSEADQKFLKWRRFNPVTAPNGMRFIGSYLDRRLPPSLGCPEIAFLGRSNVGKSSLLNKLFAAASSTGSSDQARVGKTPGATASVNLYALTSPASKQQKQSTKASKASSAPLTKDLVGFVDLPGFGYAKLSKGIQESVQEAAENYLEKRRELALGILLVDVRRTPPSDDDRAVLAALFDMGLPLLIVATKIDKIKSVAQREQNLLEIQKGLGLPEGQPLAVSSVTGEGIKPLWNIILEACETTVQEFQKTYDEKVATELQQEEEDGEDIDLLEQSDLPFEDEEDFAYSQGYDWVQDNYGYMDDSDNLSDDFEEGEEWQDEEEDDINMDLPSRTREDLRSLKKRARDMERRENV